MDILLRLLRMTLATILGIIVFAALSELTVAWLGRNAIKDNAHTPSMWAALGWGVFFRGPSFVFFGTVPLLIVLALAEWRSFRGPWAYLLIWVAAALATARFNPAMVPAGLVAGTLYWLIAGRSAGAWLHRRPMRGPKAMLAPARYASYAVLAYLAFQLVGYLFYGGKLLWVSYISEPGAGTPAFQTKHNSDLNAPVKVALMNFPDAASCLEDAGSDQSMGRLKKLDWDKIDNDAEATVCIFRLLATYPDASYATDWFEAQGFKLSQGFRGPSPLTGQDGSWYVNGYHSIREKGPKFPTRGIFRRTFRSIAYGMDVNATWTRDGRRLLWVEISYLTL